MSPCHDQGTAGSVAPPSRWTRRLMLTRSAAAGLLAVLSPGGRALAAATTAAGPTASAGVITLTLARYAAFDSLAPSQYRYEEPLFEGFLRAHRGVRLQLDLSPPFPGQGGLLPSVLAGKGPDIVQVVPIGPWVAKDLLLPLNPFLKVNHLDPAHTFAPAQLAPATYGSTLYGLPAYLSIPVMTVNLGVLDSLGLARPSPDWTWQEFAKLARAVTGGPPHRWGTGFFNNPPQGTALPSYLLHGWGASLMDDTRTRCTLNSPQAIACAQFMFGMQFDGVADPAYGAGGAGEFRAKTRPVVLEMNFHSPLHMAIWYLQAGINWDFWPMPRWPTGVTTFADANYHAINAGTRHPELAFELLWYVTASRDFWYPLIHMTGQGPGAVAYWNDYADLLRAVAPPLRTKRVEVYPEMVQANAPVPARDFLYHPTQSVNIADKWLGQIAARKVSVADGLAQASAQITALQTAAAAASQKTKAAVHP